MEILSQERLRSDQLQRGKPRSLEPRSSPGDLAEVPPIRHLIFSLRALIPALLAITSTPAFAGEIAFDPQCWKNVHESHYILKSDSRGEKSAGIGARLWSIDRLVKDWQKSQDSCVNQVFEQAVNDQNEYWDLIGKNYHCAEDSSESPSRQCKDFASNKAWLGMVSSALAVTKKGPGCGPDGSPVSNAVVALAQDTVPLVQPEQKAQDQSCDHVPEAQRAPATLEPPSLIPNPMRLYDCGVGVVKQIIAELRGMAHLVDAAVKNGVFSGLANLARAVYDDPAGVAMQIVKNVWNYYVEDLSDFSCYNEATRWEKACKTASKVALTYFTGKLLNPAFILTKAKIAQVAEAATTGAKAGVKNGIQAVRGKAQAGAAGASSTAGASNTAAAGATSQGAVPALGPKAPLETVTDKTLVLSQAPKAPDLRVPIEKPRVEKTPGSQTSFTDQPGFQKYRSELEELKSFRKKEPKAKTKKEDCYRLASLAKKLASKWSGPLTKMGYSALNVDVGFAYAQRNAAMGCAQFGMGGTYSANASTTRWQRTQALGAKAIEKAKAGSRWTVGKHVDSVPGMTFDYWDQKPAYDKAFDDEIRKREEELRKYEAEHPDDEDEQESEDPR